MIPYVCMWSSDNFMQLEKARKTLTVGFITIYILFILCTRSRKRSETNKYMNGQTADFIIGRSLVPKVRSMFE